MSFFQASSTALLVRRREPTSRHDQVRRPIDERTLPYVEQAGFIGPACLPYIQLDWHLISALVERWRPETHSFYMPHGEMTITLQDVEVQLGLPVHDLLIVGSTSIATGWQSECIRLLGTYPLGGTSRRGRLSLTWLRSHFF